MSWRMGDEVVLRYLDRDGAIEGVRPLRVVASDERYLAGFLPAGTPIMEPILPDGRPIRAGSRAEQFTLPRRPSPRRWRDGNIVMLVPWVGAHSVWVFWDEAGRFLGWYVNLEQRHVFSRHSIDTRDHVLDIWVAPDRSWRWKDEEELKSAVAHGFLTSCTADEIRAEGERVLAAVRDWGPPFRDGWERWAPDPDWPLPSLPDDWSSRVLPA